MSEHLDLSCFIPEDRRGETIELREDLIPVIERISRVLPTDKIWEFYSSQPNETRGKVTFPYYRVDKSLAVVCQGYLYMLKTYNPTPEKYLEWYRLASLIAIESLLWVEVGFEGLENLAKSPASRNWTIAVRYSVSDEERAVRILAEGAELYRECLAEYARFRTEQGITEDYFAEYNVEHLLNPFI